MKAKGSWLGAILFGLFFFLSNLHVAYIRLLWFDEISTLRIVKLPDLATLWQVQTSSRADSAPITYHLLIRLFYWLSGHDDISVRIVSALAMSVALLVVFDCTKRLTDGVHGLIALCVLASSFLTHYGYEGRPYTLVVLVTAIALWVWLHTEPDSKRAAATFGAAIFLAVTMHFNAVLAMVPFGTWELYRWRRWQWPSPKFVAGAVGVLCAVGLSVRQIRHSADWSTDSWCPPSLPALVLVFPQIFPSGLFVLAGFAILVFLTRTVKQPIGDSERLCWLFLTIPFAGYLLAEAVTNSFYNRYLIAILPGVAVAFACLVSRHLNQVASMTFLLFFTTLVVGRQLEHARNPEAIEPPSAMKQQVHTRQAIAVEDRIVADGKTVIITDFLLLDEMRYYSKRPVLYAMYGPDTDPLFCKYFGSACWNLNTAKGHATEIAGFYASETFIHEMTKAGFQATVKITNPMVVYFSPR